MTVRLPSGIEEMSKEKLWEWFERSTRAHRELAAVRGFLWNTTTGLHRAHVERSIPDYRETIELQRVRIKGLETQMQQMHKGYRRKIARLERNIAAIKESE